MLVVGLTGGIGSGKSAFARLLEARGAELIDADALGRAALEPGRPAWHSVVDQFGDEILEPGGMNVNRKTLARIVFNDKDKLAALNAIVHPVIMGEIADTLETLRGTNEIVVVDAALIFELGLAGGMDVIIIVVAPLESRRVWLSSSRGMSIEEIEQRMAAQLSAEDQIERADIVVKNEGTIDDLAEEADRVWAELMRRRDTA
ncbi:MAG: dephospho-CoA kinase [Actinomycetota bacterium]